MSPFWVGLFENLRDRGRNATLFLVALAGVIGLLFVSGAFSTATGSKGFGDYFGFVLAGFGLLAAIRFGRAVWRSFFGKRDRLNISRLSSDELSKARSKLLKNQKRGSV